MMKLIISIIILILITGCNSTEENLSNDDSKAIKFSDEEKTTAIIEGKKIAENTFKVLGGNLKSAMAKGGVENAINYCNANANNIMDSLGTHHNAIIKRLSNKLRNPKNAPTTEEQKILDLYHNDSEKKPMVSILPSGNKQFYAPIKMKPLCITCHGTVGKTVTEKDYATILKHYPNDKAKGYKEGDFRGIWSIELKK